MFDGGAQQNKLLLIDWKRGCGNRFRRIAPLTASSAVLMQSGGGWLEIADCSPYQF